MIFSANCISYRVLFKNGDKKIFKVLFYGKGKWQKWRKIVLKWTCQILPIFKSLFYKVQTVYRQESYLGAFVSVCGCGNEKTVQALKQNKFSSL